MIKLKIGGVPEHFNYPWYLTLKNKEYDSFNISLRWQDFHGGTGEMCEALRNGTTDIAIILTEGIIKDIANGNPSKILQTYVKSPLIWGIHVAKSAPFKSIDALKNKTVAISRYGSGSHLMAIVNAFNQGWDIKSLNYKVVNDINGGIDALTNGEADYFMWEHFTTKPYVDNGILYRVGNCPTPWPCFVIAARNEVIEKHPNELRNILEVINKKTQHFKSTFGIANILAKRYNQKMEDIKEWLEITNWNSENNISEEFIEGVQNKMIQFNVIDQKKSPKDFIKNMYI